ncbi:MAG: nuclear transport factor 2 family protein [Rhodobacteraceae bacterium]|nr:nuclear transport factor 2 family protein [Paracoccaceae bacterium]
MKDIFSLVPKAKAYVAASNAHDLNLIAQLLNEDCRYNSSGVGGYRGKAAIISMMEGFFSNNPNVHWDVPEYRLDGQLCVVFDFTISLGGQSNRGLEKISFAEDGLIAIIEVIR